MSTYHHAAPTLLRGVDLSENSLYTRGLPSTGYPLPGDTGGCVWDVGANDGVWHSNSHYLINYRNAHAWLFEPDASTFLKLRQLYSGTHSSTVEMFNVALSSFTGLQRLRVFPIGFENTIVKGKSNQFDSQVDEYSVGVFNAGLLCEQRRKAEDEGLCLVASSSHPEINRSFAVLSVDVEGVDGAVVVAAHADAGCTWDIVIVETVNPALLEKMQNIGYNLVLRSAYNHIFVWNDTDKQQ